MATISLEDGIELEEETNDDVHPNISAVVDGQGNVVDLVIPGTPVSTNASHSPIQQARPPSQDLQVETGFAGPTRKSAGASGNSIFFNDTGPSEHVTLSMADIPATKDQAIQVDMFDDDLIKQLPSSTVRPATVGRERRASKIAVQRHSLRGKSIKKRNQVAPLDIDAPKRLQERDNARANLKGFRLLMYDLKQWYHFQRTKRRDPIPLWRTSIKRIEGRFGSAMTSFFVFLRWLFLLNLFIAIIICSFILAPQAIRFDYETSIISHFDWFNVFDGAGAVGESWLFYGGYSSSLHGYRMDLIYVLVIVATIVGCFLFIVNNITSAMGTLNSSGSLVKMDNKNPFTTIILMSWDYSFTEKEGVHTLQSGIKNALTDALAEERARLTLEQLGEATFKEKLDLFGRRLFAWFFWAMLVTGSFVAVWYVIDDGNENEKQDFFDTYGPTIVFSVINGFLPFPIRKIAAVERYSHPKFELQITIIRTFLLRIMTIYALLYGLFTKYELSNIQLPVYEDGTITPQDSCAGTLVGQEIWKLIFVDTFVSVIQGYLNLRFFKWYYGRPQQLQVVQIVLALVYRQGLIWAGMFFSPGLTVLAMFSNIIFFYFYRTLGLSYFSLVRALCRPPDKRFMQNRNNTFFMFTLALTLFLVAVPLCWAFMVYKPNCGPYASSQYSSVFDGIWEWVKDQDNSLQQLLVTIYHPAVATGAFILFVVWIMLLRTKIQRYRSKYMESKRELDGLRQDKRFLLGKTSNIKR